IIIEAYSQVNRPVARPKIQACPSSYAQGDSPLLPTAECQALRGARSPHSQQRVPHRPGESPPTCSHVNCTSEGAAFQKEAGQAAKSFDKHIAAPLTKPGSTEITKDTTPKNYGLPLGITGWFCFIKKKKKKKMGGGSDQKQKRGKH
ncbi:uncharacterized protein PgNI_02946, partial [Pyricularia grisea]|uniref:Uncharacterized protein n=1 Tax=Pyricularia grisea TaxID=148305 RepID=A0A6P8B9Z5_PYRGI